jgi:transposase-like protein
MSSENDPEDTLKKLLQASVELSKSVEAAKQAVENKKKEKKKEVSTSLYTNKDVLLNFLEHQPFCKDEYVESNGFRSGYKVPKCAKCALYFLKNTDAQNINFKFVLSMEKDNA